MRKKRARQRAVRDRLDIPYASLQRDIRSLRNDQKLSRDTENILSYPFSSSRCRRLSSSSSSSHVWSHRRRSSLLSRIHTLLLLCLLLSSIPSSSSSPSFSLSFIALFFHLLSFSLLLVCAHVISYSFNVPTPCFVLTLGLASRNRVGR